jgi:hypothetical protein
MQRLRDGAEVRLPERPPDGADPEQEGRGA